MPNNDTSIGARAKKTTPSFELPKSIDDIDNEKTTLEKETSLSYKPIQKSDKVGIKYITNKERRYKAKVNTYITEEYKEKLSTLSFLYKVPISTIVNNILSLFLDENGKLSLNDDIHEELKRINNIK